MALLEAVMDCGFGNWLVVYLFVVAHEQSPAHIFGEKISRKYVYILSEGYTSVPVTS